MSTSNRPCLLRGSLAAILFSSHVACHMNMIYPVPIRSKYSFKASSSAYQSGIDYSMTSPLFADGSNYPCKGYQADSAAYYEVTSFTAGGSYNITITGTDYPGTSQNPAGTALAQHSGGSCQISLSYDNGATFKVIQSVVGGCPIVPTGKESVSYDFTIPDDAPSSSSSLPALLAWSWFNKVGNREMYMNCARVEINPPVAKRSAEAPYHGYYRPHHHRPARPNQFRALTPPTPLRRSSDVPFSQLPLIFTANIGSKSPCTTVEGCDYVYPNPGPHVSYGNGTAPAACTGSGAASDGFVNTPSCAAAMLQVSPTSTAARTFTTSVLSGGGTTSTTGGYFTNTSTSHGTSYHITDTLTLTPPTVTQTQTQTQTLTVQPASASASTIHTGAPTRSSPSTTLTSAPTPIPTEASCSSADDGMMECFPAEGATHFRECVFGGWVYFDTAPGTVCRYTGDGTGVYNGYPRRALGRRG